MFLLNTAARAVAAAGCALVLTCCSSATQTDPPPPAAGGTELDTAVPASLLTLPLTDQNGRQVTLGSFRGKIVVISDLLTLCQETCAIGTASMLQAARAVDAAGLTDRVEFLSITIDPRRDDQRHLAAYYRLFGRLPNWKVLTGSPHAIEKLWDTLGVWRRTVSVERPYPRDWLTDQPLKVDIQHSDDLIFVDADQRFRYEIEGPGQVPSASTIPQRIFTFMNRSGNRNVSHPSPGSWSATAVEKVLRWLVDAGAPS